jgi:hypothetical protein
MKPKSRTNETHKAQTLALAPELWALHPHLLLADCLRDSRHVLKSPEFCSAMVSKVALEVVDILLHSPKLLQKQGDYLCLRSGFVLC